MNGLRGINNYSFFHSEGIRDTNELSAMTCSRNPKFSLASTEGRRIGVQ